MFSTVYVCAHEFVYKFQVILSYVFAYIYLSFIVVILSLTLKNNIYVQQARILECLPSTLTNNINKVYTFQHPACTYSCA